MKVRKVYVTGEINHDNYAAFAKEMSELESLSRTKDITVEICSGGGIANAAYAYVARMRLSPCTVKTIGMGEIASAATIILVAGNLRAMAKESLLMVHEDSGEFEGSVSEIERVAADSRWMEEHWNQIFSRYTGKSENFWTVNNQATTWFNAEQALEAGIVDEII